MMCETCDQIIEAMKTELAWHESDEGKKEAIKYRLSKEFQYGFLGGLGHAIHIISKVVEIQKYQEIFYNEREKS